ncbi:hypothetical protein B0H19DRAFT_1192461 [Mycena capillaripes]|nr:hypothetical protein B0H19DRAFT_1192461 [Mycena capillaripes]
MGWCATSGNGERRRLEYREEGRSARRGDEGTGAAGAADDAGAARRVSVDAGLKWESAEDVAASAEATTGTPAAAAGVGHAGGSVRPAGDAPMRKRPEVGAESGRGVPGGDECDRGDGKRRQQVLQAQGVGVMMQMVVGAAREGQAYSAAVPERVIAGARRGKQRMRGEMDAWGAGHGGGIVHPSCGVRRERQPQPLLRVVYGGQVLRVLAWYSGCTTCGG